MADDRAGNSFTMKELRAGSQNRIKSCRATAWRRPGRVGLILGLLFLLASIASQISSAQAQGNTATTLALAKASPLLVYDNPALTGGRNEEFEFGRPYEVIEQTSESARIKLRDGKPAYVRQAHVTLVRSPRFLAATSGYNRAERPRIRLWESSVKLNDFLSGINTAGSQWDYEEYFDAVPGFQLKLPIVETDTLDLLGGTRPVRIVSVILPISKQMYQAFDHAKTGGDKTFGLHFLIDISGSTKGFLEPVMATVTKALTRNDELRKLARTITVTTFGASRTQKSAFLGAFSGKDIEGLKWSRAGVDQATEGEREPLIDGLVTMTSNPAVKNEAAPLLLILSGADVELEATVRGQAKPVTIENLDLGLPANAAAIFAQITPEPSNDLRNGSRKLRNVSTVRYVEYSDNLGDDVLTELLKTADVKKTASIAAEEFAPVVKAAHGQRMMTFLPRVLTPGASLPARQSYAQNSDWYTVRLWLTLDELLWKETAQ
jgi:hypothetical protein